MKTMLLECTFYLKRYNTINQIFKVKIFLPIALVAKIKRAKVKHIVQITIAIQANGEN